MSATENTTPTPADLDRMARELGFRPRTEAPVTGTEDQAVPEPVDQAAELRREMFAAWFEAEAARAGFDGEALAGHFDPATFTGDDERLDREAVREFVAMLAGRSGQ
ncbi:hypothetical protein HMPREF3105_09430 [Micrococcus sp. HMSC31B01]|uniref:hypothetical protein n=1 Tax=Micrococcus sp. HMSC31B01 TaxID=1581073 RepID=UPI0008A13D4A|nr:hypothetical protein [Micrococcus sp. HMSC31B01]OFS08392.1 hypothetical protein HMPREF3105_09430 [Micrococcus sp. HMSC31B01]